MLKKVFCSRLISLHLVYYSPRLCLCTAFIKDVESFKMLFYSIDNLFY